MKKISLIIFAFLILFVSVKSENLYKNKSGIITYKRTITTGVGEYEITHKWDNFGALIAHSYKGSTKNSNGYEVVIDNLMIIDSKKKKTWIIDNCAKTILQMSEVVDDLFLLYDEDDSVSDELENQNIKPKRLKPIMVLGKKCYGKEVNGVKIWKWKGLLMKQIFVGDDFKVQTIATEMSFKKVKKKDFILPKKGYTDLSKTFNMTNQSNKNTKKK